jgi:hypothetical protein
MKLYDREKGLTFLKFCYMVSNSYMFNAYMIHFSCDTVSRKVRAPNAGSSYSVHFWMKMAFSKAWTSVALTVCELNTTEQNLSWGCFKGITYWHFSFHLSYHPFGERQRKELHIIRTLQYSILVHSTYCTTSSLQFTQSSEQFPVQ